MSYRPNTYKAHILAHLTAGETLDDMKALNLFGCWSLSQRISEMRADGIPIISKMVTAPSGKRHAIYWLEPQDREPTRQEQRCRRAMPATHVTSATTSPRT